MRESEQRLTRAHEPLLGRLRRVGTLAVVAWAFASCPCLAQPAPAPPPSGFRPSESPLLAPPPATAPAQQPPSGLEWDELAEEPRRHLTPAVQLGGYLTVPTFFTNIHEVASTGFGLAMHFGYDLGYIVPELHFGWQYHDLDVSHTYSDSLNRRYFSMGLKVEGDNQSIVTPFLGASFDFNWWSKPFQHRTVCGWSYCWLEDVYTFAPGFTGRAGVSIKPSPSYSIDLGLEVGMSFQGSAFFQDEAWVGPLIGAAGYLPI